MLEDKEEDIREDTENNLLRKISVCLFLYNEPISISKLKIISELEEIEEYSLENIFTLLNKKLSEIGLILLRDSNKIFEKQELLIGVKEHMGVIARNIKKEELSGELTPAALQVMTIIGYLDGPTKEDISLIRGAQSSQIIRTLSARGLIKNEADKYLVSIAALLEMGISKVSELPEFEKTQQDFRERLNDIMKAKK